MAEEEERYAMEIEAKEGLCNFSVGVSRSKMSAVERETMGSLATQLMNRSV
jgi:hypothetical protein